MAGAEITERELIEAIQEALAAAENPDGAMTARELVEATGLHYRAVLARLRVLKEQGKLEALRVSRENLAGMMHAEPAYRLRRDAQ